MHRAWTFESVPEVADLVLTANSVPNFEEYSSPKQSSQSVHFRQNITMSNSIMIQMLLRADTIIRMN